jgi:uncharacterized protein (UPF0332 family)
MNPQKKELINYRLARAKETLNEVEWNIEKDFLSSAINRLYYASYYSIIALLTYYDIDTKTHSGVKQMFGLHFIKTGIVNSDSGKFYTDIFNMRHKGDYDDFIEFKKEDVLDLLISDKNLFLSIESILLKELNT